MNDFLNSFQLSSAHLNLKIIVILTVGFAIASLLGYLSYRCKLSPILGYLLGGYLIGPYSPGFVADLEISEQLAEIGVILMLFGVGLHFKWTDLRRIKNIAIPGALLQIVMAVLFVIVLAYLAGWDLKAGIIFGLAVAVASTVVLVKMLSDHKLLHTEEGKISIGWLVIEDMVTVLMLLIVPTLAASNKAGFSFGTLTRDVLIVLVKFAILFTFMFTVGKKIIRFILSRIIHVPHELFILVILTLTFIIAIGSTFFGISIALGAFLAGMVMGQTDVRHKVSTNTSALKDIFMVLFFLSIGMLFNPIVIYHHFFLFLITVGIILIIKPLAAYFIVLWLKHPVKTAVTIAIALAQIGEFSFILIEQATRFQIVPDQGYDLIVASSLVTIAINPFLFKLLKIRFGGDHEALERENRS